MSLIVKASLVEWNEERGFGFLQAGRQRVFLHRRDFLERRKPPEIGDVINFEIGKDPQGRTCARRAVHADVPRGRTSRALRGSFSLAAVCVFFCLLVFPVLAMGFLPKNFEWVRFYAAIVAIITVLVYGQDKRQAREGQWRISESTLHFLDAIGGWPGGFLAQHLYRHKISKLPFQVTFWCTVLAYQFVAVDFFLDWRMSRSAFAVARELRESVEKNRSASPAR